MDDALSRDDADRARTTPPGRKLLQALEMMRLGIAMKRGALERRHPDASPAEISEMLDAWLERRDELPKGALVDE